jgi:hypothetical protein
MTNRIIRKRANPAQLVAIAIAILLATIVPIRVLALGGSAQNAPAWPTPPPGVQFAVPSEESQQATVRVSVDRPESQTEVVPVSWPGPLPLIPPIPRSELRFDAFDSSGLPLTLVVEAGTFGETVQVRVTPTSLLNRPQAGQILWAFEIEVFDIDGDELQAPLQRPLILTVPVPALAASGFSGEHLLFGRAGDDGIHLLATMFNLIDASLQTRLIKPGTIVILDDSA